MPNLAPITEQNFELARNLIAAILVDELSINPVNGKQVSVYTDRVTPIDKTNHPAININFARAEEPSLDNACNTFRYTYNIDCYANGLATVDAKAGKDAGAQLHRLIAIVKQVMLNQVYKNLLFTNGTVQNRSIDTIGVMDPFQKLDALSSHVGRIEYSIKLADSMQLGDSVAATSLLGRITLGDSDDGFLWQIDQ